MCRPTRAALFQVHLTDHCTEHCPDGDDGNDGDEVSCEMPVACRVLRAPLERHVSVHGCVKEFRAVRGHTTGILVKGFF